MTTILILLVLFIVLFPFFLLWATRCNHGEEIALKIVHDPDGKPWLAQSCAKCGKPYGCASVVFVEPGDPRAER